MIVTLNQKKLRDRRREKALTHKKLAEQSGQYIRNPENEAAQPSASLPCRWVESSNR